MASETILALFIFFSQSRCKECFKNFTHKYLHFGTIFCNQGRRSVKALRGAHRLQNNYDFDTFGKALSEVKKLTKNRQFSRRSPYFTPEFLLPEAIFNDLADNFGPPTVRIKKGGFLKKSQKTYFVLQGFPTKNTCFLSVQILT